jgi:hypothetical protein
MVALSIRTKIIAALVLGLLAIALATAAIARFVHERAVAAAVHHEVEQAARTLERLQALEVDRLASIAEVLAADDRLAARFEARDRAGLLAVARPLFESFRANHGVTHWYFHPPAPNRDGVFLRVHRPDLSGDPVLRPVVLAAVHGGHQTSGLELGRTAYALRVVQPWRRDGRLLGFLELGEDAPTFLAHLKEMTGDEYAMVLVKDRLDRAAWGVVASVAEDWDARAELVTIEATGARDELLRGIDRVADLPAAARALDDVQEEGGRSIARGVFPLRDSRGDTIGAVIVRRDVTALHAGAAEVRARVVLLVGFLAVALAALVVFMLEALVFERLSRMARTLEDLPARLERGDVELSELGPRADDEIGRFEAFFAKALRQVGAFVADVRRDRPEPRRRAGPPE